jgi:hypothetical protein
MKGKRSITQEGFCMTDRITQLAFKIADGSARSDIEILCAPVGGEPTTIDEIRACWYDLDQVIDPATIAVVRISAEYLACRGLLKRHPVHTNWVRPRHTASEAD